MVIGTGPIECRERLGGLRSFYYREGRVAPWVEFLHRTGAKLPIN
jgi:hypothetical protein